MLARRPMSGCGSGKRPYLEGDLDIGFRVLRVGFGGLGGLGGLCK